MKKIDLSIMAARWPSSIVAREKVGEFSGGIINPKTIANMDSVGEGPKGRITIGRKVVLLLALNDSDFPNYFSNVF